ncbi:hypothetical protein [Kitasatospora cheerisanensis]|uniref:Uncharacterized protein n=1 Tax=Kitasatospora cheerisanensis KCTC 2395 TaxID=1348663 RepID=A0A066YW20_9ACTN|nr:hypothetical protein [Kitasatospora cheerisanensis]KDN85713.1 hypothetical protein KCH_25410 [Kitasatospora cheerisanensis KCTC 2395]
MTTGDTPEELVRETEHALTAARAAVAFTAANPTLPVAYFVAWGPSDRGISAGPLLEIHLANEVDALQDYAKGIGATVDSSGGTFTVTTALGPVTVLLTACYPVDDEPSFFDGHGIL